MRYVPRKKITNFYLTPLILVIFQVLLPHVVYVIVEMKSSFTQTTKGGVEKSTLWITIKFCLFLVKLERDALLIFFLSMNSYRMKVYVTDCSELWRALSLICVKFRHIKVSEYYKAKKFFCNNYTVFDPLLGKSLLPARWFWNRQVANAAS